MTDITAVTTASFERDVVGASADQPVLVDFWAPWCGPCRMLAPVLDQIATEFVGRLRVRKLNTDEEPAVAARYGIRGIPAVKLFHGGKVVAEFVGAQPLAAVRAFLERHLPRPSAPDLEAARAAIARGAFDEARHTLEALCAREPDNAEAVIALAEAQALAGDGAAARATLGTLSPSMQSDPPVRAGYARAYFADLRAAPDETDVIQSARVRAAVALLRGELERGLDELLGVMQRNRRFAGGQGREDLLRAFDLAPADHPRVAQARRQLAALLH